MEALRQDDPRRIGPYAVLARLRETASAVQYLARGTATDGSGTTGDSGTTDGSGADGGRPDPAAVVVVTAARAELAVLPAFRRRFQAEARTAELLAGAGDRPLPAALADGTDGELPWTAVPYTPALTLAEAIELAGPLSERAVRILGAGMAQTLSRVHATGGVLQGLAPRTVLLTGDGPRLAAFGPLGAAAAAETRPGGQLSVRLGYLTPEQVEGEEPGPASDLFVLGLLLAYAATGTTPLADGPAAEGAARIARTDPELGAVPERLRDPIARCLAKDPAQRPGAEKMASELAPEGLPPRAEDGAWLPEPLISALERQRLRVRELTSAARPAADTRTAQLGDVGRRVTATDRPTTQLSVPQQLTGSPATPAAPPADTTARPLPPPAAEPAPASPASPAPAAPPVPGSSVAAAPAAPVPSAAAAPPAAPAASDRRGIARAGIDRRGLFIGLAAGVAGLAVGGGGAFALASGDGGTDSPAPAPGPSGPTVAGLPPRPRWVYRHPAAEPAPLAAALWNDRLLVLTGEDGASGVDLRTGRRIWRSAEAAKGRTVLPAGPDLCFVAVPTGFLWLSAKNGEVVHRENHAERLAGAPDLAVPEVVGGSGSVVWFTGSHQVTVKAPPPKKGKKRGKDQRVVRSYLFAHDIVSRKELWHAPVPAGRGPAAPGYRLIALRENDVVLRQTPATLAPADVAAAKGKAVFRCFDRKTGKQLWARAIGTVAPDGAAAGDDQGLLYAAVGDGLQAFETATGRPKWTLNGTAGAPYGTPVVSGTLLHTTSRDQQVGAVERATGRPRWRRSTEAPAGAAAPAVTVSGTGRTLLASDAAQVTAFAAQDGRRLWKFQDIGAQDPQGPTVTAPYRVLASGRTAVVQRDRIFYAFPVA
ncbi:outer membrane protein assembly factor BamB family protein [Streptomyces sp. PTD5-9]|uniref:outer membrane protein assembly factor BamB family protein n=1 Tax=Streptomyces sp. PTD5-9 TaxID=3120150 RepID=UPI00300A2B79